MLCQKFKLLIYIAEAFPEYYAISSTKSGGAPAAFTAWHSTVFAQLYKYLKGRWLFRRCVESVYDAIVVGSGAAGTLVALGLSGAKTVVIDAGLQFAEATSLHGNLYDLRKRQSLFAETVGTHFESLAWIDGPELSPKVKSPLMRPVFARPPGAPDVLSDDLRSAPELRRRRTRQCLGGSGLSLR